MSFLFHVFFDLMQMEFFEAENMLGDGEPTEADFQARIQKHNLALQAVHH